MWPASETKTLYVNTPWGCWCIVCGKTVQALKIIAFMPHWTRCWQHIDVVSELRVFRKIIHHPPLNICMFDALFARPLIHNHNISDRSEAWCRRLWQIIWIVNPAVNLNLKIHFAFIFSQNSHFVEKNITSNFKEIHQFWKHKHRILTLTGQGEMSSYSQI